MQLLFLATLLLTTYDITAQNSNAADRAKAVLESLKRFNEMSKRANEVNNAKTTWKAQISTNFDYNDENVKSLSSLQVSEFDYMSMATVGFADFLQGVDAIPVNFTAGVDKFQNCNATISEITDQSYCGSCWAVSAATVMTDRLCIATNGTDKRKVSYQDLLECCPNCGYKCRGGSTVFAYNYWVNTGICTGGAFNTTNNCKPYIFPPCNDPLHRLTAGCLRRNTTVTCSNTCNSSYTTYPFLEDRSRLKGRTAYRVLGGEEIIKREIFTNGPVTAAFMVYQDFMTYKSGIYQYRTGAYLGGHAIKIIGWGEENGVKYWTIANSWGPRWGERGFFRMLRGVNHLQIETYVVAGMPQIA
jgi:cathepsin B